MLVEKKPFVRATLDRIIAYRRDISQVLMHVGRSFLENQPTEKSVKEAHFLGTAGLLRYGSTSYRDPTGFRYGPENLEANR